MLKMLNPTGAKAYFKIIVRIQIKEIILYQCRLDKKYECCVRKVVWRTAMVRVPTN